MPCTAFLCWGRRKIIRKHLRLKGRKHLFCSQSTGFQEVAFGGRKTNRDAGCDAAEPGRE